MCIIINPKNCCRCECQYVPIFKKSKSDLIYIHAFCVCYHLSIKFVGYRNELRSEV